MNDLLSSSILVIGTDSHFCYLMRRYVRESNHPLLFAGPDAKALELAQRERPALIVMEEGLPDHKCLEMIRGFKSNSSTSQIPVVMCAWHDDEIGRSQEGADVYLRMPVLYGDFVAVLNNFGI